MLSYSDIILIIVVSYNNNILPIRALYCLNVMSAFHEGVQNPHCYMA